MVAGRPKLSIEIANATGAAKAHPERYRDAADLTQHSLGPPAPFIIDEGLADNWNYWVRSISWLTEADRRLVELACTYRANAVELARNRVPYINPDTKQIVDGVMLIEVDHRATALEIRLLEKLGATPTSRPKVVPPGHKGGHITRRKDWW